jgi:hypothetical protein
MPYARYQRVVAANPGYYTMPAFEIKYPYGLANTQVDANSLSQAFGKNLVLLLGDKDTNPDDPDLRKTPKANEQGATRFERGHYFFRHAQEKAAELDAPFSWSLSIVPNAGHSNKEMSEGAAKVLFD